MSKSPQAKSKEHVLRLLGQGQLGAAKGLLDEMLRSDRRDADAWFLLGAVSHRSGLHDEAARCYEKAVLLDPSHSEAYYHLGNVRGENGENEGAIRCYRKALQLRPRFAEAARNLGAILQNLQRTREAIECYEQFLRQAPPSADVCFNLGNALSEAGLFEAAIARYRQALELDPGRADIYINLGIAFDEREDIDEAVAQYEKALSVDPDSAPACRCLGAALAEQGRPEKAMACYRRALSLSPDDAVKVRLATLLPAIPGSLEELHHWRARFESEIARLDGEPLALSEPVKEVAGTNFLLSYHGLNNRDLHTRVASLYTRACPSLGWTAPHCAHPKPRSGKARVGFISQYFHNHSIGKTSRGILAKLSRERFEVVSLFVPPLREDETSTFIRANSDRSMVLPRTLEAARSAVAELELDILFYQDIGMEPITYFLAFSRLAPVQCVSFGHPDTTGIANMDYFISNDLFEPAGAAQHYSERLFLLRDLGTLAYYYRPRLPEAVKRREDFGLPAGRNLYLCPQTLFKLHPAFDLVLAGILRADPRGLIVLIRSRTSSWVELLEARFRRAMPDVADRIVFLPQQGSGDFLSLLAAGDVILDTIHFNGMNTSLEAFSVGTPIVTLPAEFQRGRHTAGMYRKMGVTECIAADNDDYVDIAVKLGAEQDYRRQIGNEILKRNEILFEDMRAVREFERCFDEALGRTG